MSGKRSLNSLNSNPRFCAYTILNEFADDSIVTDGLGDTLSDYALSDDDKRLAYELVSGVIRHRDTLDTLITWYSTSKAKMSNHVRNLARIGIYQIKFCDRIPDFASVNETVNLANQCGQKKSAGFINALLRSIIRSPEIESQHKRGLSVVGHMAYKHSHPEWLIKRWLNQFDKERLKKICVFNNIKAPLVIRINPLKTSLKQQQALLSDAGISCEPSPIHPQCLRVYHAGNITLLPGYNEGFFFVQDDTPATLIDLMPVTADSRILDMCAAPGGKTCATALKLPGTNIIAIDKTSDKIALIQSSARRLGIDTISAFAADAASPESLNTVLGNSTFNRIIVDAPCSNTGVLRKRPEARWRLKPDDFKRLPKLQMRILETVSPYLTRGGLLLYMTCSIDAAENNELVQKFTAGHPDYGVVVEHLHVPSSPASGDGGYAALITRID